MSLQYSEFEPSIQNQNKDRKKNNRNQTLKKRKKEKSVKVKSFLEAIENDEDNGLNDLNTQTANQKYRDFTPEISKGTPKVENKNEINDDDVITKEAFDNIQVNNNDEYYKKFVPYYNKLANSQEVSGDKDLLLEKLNYMIHLLEDQQEEKTGHITEELILYTFLGVFVIFVVDSFARAGKYVR